MKQDTEFLSEAVFQHQRFLEAVDGNKRAENLIITGVAEATAIKSTNDEGEEESATTDNEKVSLILKKIGHHEDIDVVEVATIGKERKGASPKPRPLKVITRSNSQRNLALDDAKKLKNAGGDLGRIRSRPMPRATESISGESKFRAPARSGFRIRWRVGDTSSRGVLKTA